jgi:hypothetical protein
MMRHAHDDITRFQHHANCPSLVHRAIGQCASGSCMTAWRIYRGRSATVKSLLQAMHSSHSSIYGAALPSRYWLCGGYICAVQEGCRQPPPMNVQSSNLCIGHPRDAPWVAASSWLDRCYNLVHGNRVGSYPLSPHHPENWCVAAHDQAKPGQETPGPVISRSSFR